VSEQADLSARDIIGRYPVLRDDHLRYLEKWGLVRPDRGAGGRTYRFSDLAVIRQTAAALSEGRPFRAVVRQLEAERNGQLALDFRLEAQPARVLALTPRDARAASVSAPVPEEVTRAEALFTEASSIDSDQPGGTERAAELYRRALLSDPFLVAAIVNLGNLHYAQGRLPEALALYEQGAHLAPDFFEAHYNRANALHDMGRFDEAATAYLAALAVDDTHAEAHFYLAVTFEKLESSADARPHWEAYRQLAPDGAWAELAREFTEVES
jgi:tetratricopeptide (TPR) repeat protein